jgi:hypothetical protein
MIDQNLNVFLIEINTNPCLELSSTLLGRIIPPMVEQSLRLALDPLFPPPAHYSNTTKYTIPDCSLSKLNFELLFDEGRDGESLNVLYKKQMDEYDEMTRKLV